MLHRLGKLKYRVALVVVLLLLAFFAIRAFDAYKGLMEKMLYGHADMHSVRGWMNVDRVSKLYDADPACICGQFNMTLASCSRKSVWELNDGGPRRRPPDDRQLFELMSPVFEKIAMCMYEKPPPDDWMRFTYIPVLYGVDGGCVCTGLDLSAQDCGWMRVLDLIDKRRPEEAGTVKDEVWSVVRGCRGTSGGQ